MRHQINIASGSECDVVIEIPHAISQLTQSLFELWRKFIVEKLQTICVVRGHLSRGQFARSRLVSANARRIADWQ